MGGGALTSDMGVFGENVCENERIGSRRGRADAGGAPDLQMDLMAI